MAIRGDAGTLGMLYMGEFLFALSLLLSFFMEAVIGMGEVGNIGIVIRSGVLVN